MKERGVIKENTNWWQRAVAVVLFLAGLDIVAGAETINEAVVGAGTILASVWLWGESKKQAPVTA